MHTKCRFVKVTHDIGTSFAKTPRQATACLLVLPRSSPLNLPGISHLSASHLRITNYRRTRRTAPAPFLLPARLPSPPPESFRPVHCGHTGAETESCEEECFSLGLRPSGPPCRTLISPEERSAIENSSNRSTAISRSHHVQLNIVAISITAVE